MIEATLLSCSRLIGPATMRIESPERLSSDNAFAKRNTTPRSIVASRSAVAPGNVLLMIHRFSFFCADSTALKRGDGQPYAASFVAIITSGAGSTASHLDPSGIGTDHKNFAYCH
jgi:hypothetical protein